MEYFYAPNTNYEDYASGRVLYHGKGLATFPVRLASELFQRCLSYYEGKKPISLYDPLCGEAYLLTVLGLMHGDKIEEIYGSDINPKALAIAGHNLSLLTKEGLERRKYKLKELRESYGKESHLEALESVKRFEKNLIQKRGDIPYQVLRSDLLAEDPLANKPFQASIILADVPYGGLAHWSVEGKNTMELFLNNLLPVCSPESILCIVSDKSQKVGLTESFHRIEKFQVGKRRISIFRPRS